MARVRYINSIITMDQQWKSMKGAKLFKKQVCRLNMKN